MRLSISLPGFDLPCHLRHFVLAQIPRLFALRSTISNGGGEGVELARAGSAPQTKLSAELVEFPGGKGALRECRAPIAVRQLFGAWVRFRLFSIGFVMPCVNRPESQGT